MKYVEYIRKEKADRRHENGETTKDDRGKHNKEIMKGERRKKKEGEKGNKEQHKEKPGRPRT